MEECFVCGISGDKARLFDAISSEGIKKICEKCSKDEDVLVIRRPTTFQLKEAERPNPVYSRLSKGKLNSVSSLNIDKKKEEISLRQIVDRNYQSKISETKKPHPDLVDNFHWVIMMSRRAKKITHEQLAREIQESVAAIKMAEQGILPEDDHKLINKLENSLGIKLVKKDLSKPVETKQPSRILEFDKEVMDNLTISDLKELKKRREGDVSADFEDEDLEGEEIEEEYNEDLAIEPEKKKSKGWFS